MKKRLTFSIEYSLLCTFTSFLLITVLGKHYQLDAKFLVPCLATLPAAFLAGWWHARSTKKYQHLRVGVAALVYTFILSSCGFFIIRMTHKGSIVAVSALKAMADTWTSFLSGMLIMVPAFILLVYVAKGSRQPPEGPKQDDATEPKTGIFLEKGKGERP